MKTIVIISFLRKCNSLNRLVITNALKFNYNYMANCCCGRSHSFVSFYSKQFKAKFKNGSGKLHFCFIYSQLREIVKFQSMTIPRKLNTVLRNRMASKKFLTRTQSYTETRKSYVMRCMIYGLR